MTKEELEKEAYEESEKLKEYQTNSSNEYEKGFNNGEVRGYKDGYRDGAEPREKRIAELEAQIEKMKCCSNCKYFYCPTSSKSEKDRKVLFHNWNKEKQAYCDCGNGEGEKYQLWEIKENE